MSDCIRCYCDENEGHHCRDCNKKISENECQDNDGLCNKCEGRK